MAWIAGFLGLGAVAQVAKGDIAIVPKRSRGFICLTLNVGQLPPYKAEAFIDRMKERWHKQDIRKALDDWELIIVPVRNQETKIEVFSLDGTQPPLIEAQQLIRDNTPFEAPDKQLSIDHTLLMLGAPVLQIELDPQQLEACYNETKVLFDDIAKSKGLDVLNCGGMGKEVFKNIMLAKATIMLGHIRRKFTLLNSDWKGASSLYEMDGKQLVTEGNENLIYWTQYLDAI